MGYAEQADVIRIAPVDRQAENVVVQAVEGAVEAIFGRAVCSADGYLSICADADRLKALAYRIAVIVVPGRRPRSVNAVAQGIFSAEIGVHRLKLPGVFHPHVAADTLYFAVYLDICKGLVLACIGVICLIVGVVA